MSLRTLTLKALKEGIARAATARGRRQGGRDRGGVTMLVGILLGLVLLPSTALVIDVGKLYVERGELQSGADAAAVAVAKGCAGGKCSLSADLNTQRNSAVKYANANAKDGKTQVTQVCGRWGNLPACPTAPSNFTACSDPMPAGNYVEVRVRTENKDGTHLVPPSLARTLAGKQNYDGTAVGACSRATAADVCVSAKNATYKHTFNGAAGTATVTAVSPLCAGEDQPFSLVSYTAPDAAFTVPQFLYDYETKSITSSVRSLTFTVEVPACYTQVDFVFGNKIFNPLNSAAYGDRKLGSPGAPGNTSSGPDAWYNGGNRPCAPKPIVSFTSVADGSLKVNLGNGSTANVDAAFTVTAGTGSDFYRVAKNSTTTVKVPPSAASDVVVVDSTFRTKNGKWQRP